MGKQLWKLTLRENVIFVIFLFCFPPPFIVMYISLNFKPDNYRNRLVRYINKLLNPNEFLKYEITLPLQVWKQVVI